MEPHQHTPSLPSRASMPRHTHTHTPHAHTVTHTHSQVQMVCHYSQHASHDHMMSGADENNSLLEPRLQAHHHCPALSLQPSLRLQHLSGMGACGCAKHTCRRIRGCPASQQPWCPLAVSQQLHCTATFITASRQAAWRSCGSPLTVTEESCTFV